MLERQLGPFPLASPTQDTPSGRGSKRKRPPPSVVAHTPPRKTCYKTGRIFRYPIHPMPTSRWFRKSIFGVCGLGGCTVNIFHYICPSVPHLRDPGTPSHTLTPPNWFMIENFWRPTHRFTSDTLLNGPLVGPIRNHTRTSIGQWGGGMRNWGGGQIPSLHRSSAL